jgi:hypothetical protein
VVGDSEQDGIAESIVSNRRFYHPVPKNAFTHYLPFLSFEQGGEVVEMCVLHLLHDRL